MITTNTSLLDAIQPLRLDYHDNARKFRMYLNDLHIKYFSVFRDENNTCKLFIREDDWNYLLTNSCIFCLRGESGNIVNIINERTSSCKYFYWMPNTHEHVIKTYISGPSPAKEVLISEDENIHLIIV